MRALKKRVVLSWSGGKDGCLALDKLINAGVEVVCLVTTVPKEIGRTFGHGEKMEFVKLQGEALQIPTEFIYTSFDQYTDFFIQTLKKLKDQYQVEGIAFGDLYLDGHREWGEKLAAAAGVDAYYPLWGKQEDSLLMLKNFINSGYKAKVIRVREDVLSDVWLGRELDHSFYEDIENLEICPMGESGEYHTFVYDGPLFKKKIELQNPNLIHLESTKKLEFGHYQLKEK